MFPQRHCDPQAQHMQPGFPNQSNTKAMFNLLTPKKKTNEPLILLLIKIPTSMVRGRSFRGRCLRISLHRLKQTVWLSHSSLSRWICSRKSRAAVRPCSVSTASKPHQLQTGATGQRVAFQKELSLYVFTCLSTKPWWQPLKEL